MYVFKVVAEFNSVGLNDAASKQSRQEKSFSTV